MVLTTTTRLPMALDSVHPLTKFLVRKIFLPLRRTRQAIKKRSISSLRTGMTSACPSTLFSATRGGTTRGTPRAQYYGSPCHLRWVVRLRTTVIQARGIARLIDIQQCCTHAGFNLTISISKALLLVCHCQNQIYHGNGLSTSRQASVLLSMRVSLSIFSSEHETGWA